MNARDDLGTRPLCLESHASISFNPERLDCSCSRQNIVVHHIHHHYSDSSMTKSHNPIFGLTGAGRSSSRSYRGGSNTRFTGRRGGSSFRGGRGGGKDAGSRVLDRTDDGTAAQERMEEVKIWDEIDEKLGFWRFDSGKAGGEEREGWLVNMHQVRSVGGRETCLS